VAQLSGQGVTDLVVGARQILGAQVVDEVDLWSIGSLVIDVDLEISEAQGSGGQQTDGSRAGRTVSLVMDRCRSRSRR